MEMNDGDRTEEKGSAKRPRLRKPKTILVGRLWKRPEGYFGGYLDFGLFGRLEILLFDNDKKQGTEDCDKNLVMKLDNTVFAMLKNVAGAIRDVLWEDDERTSQ